MSSLLCVNFDNLTIYYGFLERLSYRFLLLSSDLILELDFKPCIRTLHINLNILHCYYFSWQLHDLTQLLSSSLVQPLESYLAPPISQMAPDCSHNVYSTWGLSVSAQLPIPHLSPGMKAHSLRSITFGDFLRFKGYLIVTQVILVEQNLCHGITFFDSLLIMILWRLELHRLGAMLKHLLCQF